MDSVLTPPGLIGLMISGDLGPLTIYTTKKRRIVAFPKSPPHKPGSPAQLTQRYRFAQAQNAWRELTIVQQQAYVDVVNGLSICMTGANLWIHFCLMHDIGVWDTLQSQSGITLSLFPFF